MKFANSIYLTKQEMLKVADMAGEQSMSDYMAHVILDHINQPTPVRTVIVQNCARCGMNHEVEFREFRERPAGEFRYWGMCPKLQEPIWMKIVNDPTPMGESPLANAAAAAMGLKKLNGQFCPICDAWCELPDDQPDQSEITCPQGHRLLVEWAEGDFEDYHLKPLDQNVAGTIALEALTGIWQNILLPALEKAWGFVQDNLIPIFEALVTNIKSNE